MGDVAPRRAFLIFWIEYAAMSGLLSALSVQAAMLSTTLWEGAQVRWAISIGLALAIGVFGTIIAFVPGLCIVILARALAERALPTWEYEEFGNGIIALSATGPLMLGVVLAGWAIFSSSPRAARTVSAKQFLTALPFTLVATIAWEAA